MKLSEHFSLSEFLDSASARKHNIDLNPSTAVIENLRALVAHVMQPLRYAVGPIVITSGWRNKRLNAIVGGVPNSDHVIGRACDFRPTRVSYIEAGAVVETMDFDQLIYYHDEARLHVGYRREGNRKQVIHKGQP